MNNSATNLNIKRLALILATVFLGLFILFWLVNYLTTGRITITTNGAASTITITMPNDATFQKTGKKKLSLRLKPGSYAANVVGNINGITKYVDLKARQNLHYALNPPSPTSVAPVVYRNAQNIAIDNSQLVFLDPTDSHLYRIDSNNNITAISSQLFARVKWAGPNFGVGQDSSNQLYTINGQTVQPLVLPETNSGQGVNFFVASDKTIYVAVGKNIYRNTNGSFTKIYEAISPNPVLSIANDKLAVINAFALGGSNPRSTIAIQGVVDKITAPYAAEIEWSTNATYLAVITNEDGEAIYDHNLKQVEALPNDISHAAWLDDNILLYSLGSHLWSYNVSAKQTSLIANMPFSAIITEITPSSDKTYIYLAAQDRTTNNLSIKRVGLRDQVIPAYVSQLQNVVPQINPTYTLSLVNFAQPIIVIQLDADTPANRQDALNDLKSKGFDPSKIQVRFNDTGN